MHIYKHIKALNYFDMPLFLCLLLRFSLIFLAFGIPLSSWASATGSIETVYDFFHEYPRSPSMGSDVQHSFRVENQAILASSGLFSGASPVAHWQDKSFFKRFTGGFDASLTPSKPSYALIHKSARGGMRSSARIKYSGEIALLEAMTLDELQDNGTKKQVHAYVLGRLGAEREGREDWYDILEHWFSQCIQEECHETRLGILGSSESIQWRNRCDRHASTVSILTKIVGGVTAMVLGGINLYPTTASVSSTERFPFFENATATEFAGKNLNFSSLVCLPVVNETLRHCEVGVIKVSETPNVFMQRTAQFSLVGGFILFVSGIYDIYTSGILYDCFAPITQTASFEKMVKDVIREKGYTIPAADLEEFTKYAAVKFNEFWRKKGAFDTREFKHTLKKYGG